MNAAEVSQVTAAYLPVLPDPVFTTHLHEYLVSLRPTEPIWYPNRGRDLTIVQLNITFRYDPHASDVGPWVFDRAIAYAGDGGGFTHQVLRPTRVTSWRPKESGVVSFDVRAAEGSAAYVAQLNVVR